MTYIPSGDEHGGAVCDDPHVRICERRMNLFMRLLDFYPPLRVIIFSVLKAIRQVQDAQLQFLQVLEKQRREINCPYKPYW